MLRPGRVDMVVEFGYATEPMLAEYARIFFAQPSATMAVAVVAATEMQIADIAALLMKTMGPRVTLAQVQAFMFEHREGPEAMLATLAAMPRAPDPAPTQQ